MSTIPSITNTDIANEVSGRGAQALTGNDFLKLMITELTNQDPFEPMKNQDLLNQMSIIQKLQSDQEMTKSFKDLMLDFEGLLSRQSLSTATRMIGELVSGNTTDGQFALGRVVAVNMDGDEVFLEIDTGQRINWNDVIRLGGNSTQDLIGNMVIGKTIEGENVVGKIDSVEVDDNSQVLLHLNLNESTSEQEMTAIVPLRDASIINKDTADLLIGYPISGYNYDLEENQIVAGTVRSVQWSGQEVILNIVDSEGNSSRVSLDGLTKINNVI